MIVEAAGGRRFEILATGAGDRLALLLHGFPDDAHLWDTQLPALVAAGYRVWAPNQRGYRQTFRPHETRAYRVDALVDDVGALIDAAHAREVALIGHDWGGIVAWFAAMRRVRPIDKLVVMNAPHPGPFLRELRRPAQALRSWYAAFFQLPVLPELLLAPAPQMQGRRFAERRAMIDWYRALARYAPRELREGYPLIDVPTLLLWGADDFALTLATTVGTGAYVRELRTRIIAGASHWVMRDATAILNAELLAFLGNESR